MPLIKCSVRMSHDLTWVARRKWSNTFYINDATALSAAAAIATAFGAFMRPAYRPSVFAYEVYATDLVPGTDNFATVPISGGLQRGTYAAETTQPYLLKACVRVPIAVTGSRPSFKFWRPGLREEDVADGVSVVSALSTAVVNAFNAFISEFEGLLVDPDSQPLTAALAPRLTTREFGRDSSGDLPAPPLG